VDQTQTILLGTSQTSVAYVPGYYQPYLGGVSEHNSTCKVYLLPRALKHRLMQTHVWSSFLVSSTYVQQALLAVMCTIIPLLGQPELACFLVSRSVVY